MTCNAHFRTRMSYSSQKSCVKIWFGLVEELSFEFPPPEGGGGGDKPPIREVTCDLRCPFSNLAEVFQLKVICENLVWTG